jgi:epoxide hydrolase 4
MNVVDESALLEGYADLSHVRLHYVEAGEGPLVMLVHGYPEFWYSWHHQIRPLADAGFRVVAFDTRGTNLSSRPEAIEAYREELLGDDIAQLIEFLGAEAATVVGHDWGGIAAYWAAMRHPGRVARLAVLNSPHPLVYVRKPFRLYYRLVLAGLRVPKLPETRLSLWAARATFRRELVKHGHMTTAELDRFSEVWGAASRRPSTGPYRAHNQRRDDPIEARCRPVLCPVLVIYGDADPYLGPEFAEPPAEWVPQARVELLPGVNHRTQMDAPERVTELLLEFLAEMGGMWRIPDSGQ